MSYKWTKNCGNCKYFTVIESGHFIGECLFHKDLMVNIFFTCFSHSSVNEEYDFNGFSAIISEKYSPPDIMTGLIIGNAGIFGYSDFIKSNKHKVQEIDSCNNCKFFTRNTDNVFTGKCNHNPEAVSDVLHICEKHIQGNRYFRIIHPTSKSEWRGKNF